MRKKKEKPNCYMCDSPSVSGDHAPPVCIFPDDGAYRLQLIKVPSCKVHNTDKSNEDVLLQCLMTCSENANELALRVMQEEVLPRLEEKPHLIPVFLPNLRPLGEHQGRMTIDLERFRISIEAIVRGLFYFDSDYKSKLLNAELFIEWTALKHAQGLTEPPEYDLVRRWGQTLPPLDRGANPRVFQYRFDYPPDGKHGLCRMSFYEGTPIFVLWEIDQTTAPDAQDHATATAG